MEACSPQHRRLVTAPLSPQLLQQLVVHKSAKEIPGEVRNGKRNLKSTALAAFIPVCSLLLWSSRLITCHQYEITTSKPVGGGGAEGSASRLTLTSSGSLISIIN